MKYFWILERDLGFITNITTILLKETLIYFAVTKRRIKKGNISQLGIKFFLTF